MDTLNTAERVAAYTRRDQRFVREVVRGRRHAAEDMLIRGVWFIQAMTDAGADPNFIDDTANGLHDAVTKLVAGMRHDLDDAYLPPEDADIDMGELDQLLATLEK